MPLWFYPLANALAHEELSAVSQDCLDLFRVYAELQRILEARERLSEPDPSKCIDREFVSSTGWKFIVFDDCGGYDYIDDVITPDGQSLSKKFGWDFMEQHGTIYAATDEDLKEIWNWDADGTGFYGYDSHPLT